MALGPVTHLLPLGVWQHVGLVCWTVFVPFRYQPCVATEELFGNQSLQQLALRLLPGMGCAALCV